MRLCALPSASSVALFCVSVCVCICVLVCSCAQTHFHSCFALDLFFCCCCLFAGSLRRCRTANDSPSSSLTATRQSAPALRTPRTSARQPGCPTLTPLLHSGFPTRWKRKPRRRRKCNELRGRYYILQPLITHTRTHRGTKQLGRIRRHWRVGEGGRKWGAATREESKKRTKERVVMRNRRVVLQGRKNKGRDDVSLTKNQGGYNVEEE